MDGAHDLGGREGFGPVDVAPDEPVFRHDWERRVFACNFAALGANADRFRHAIERMGAVEYLTTSYYEHWLAAIEVLAVERGVVLPPVAAVPVRHDPTATATTLKRMARPWPDPAPATAATLRVGAAVRTIRHGHRGHTRLPQYLRDRAGIVTAVRGTFRVPDEGAAGRPDVREAVYAVRFDATELWGPAAGPNETVTADLWQRYLQ